MGKARITVDVQIRIQDCVRAVSGEYSERAIRNACDSGEIKCERNHNNVRLVSFVSLNDWASGKGKKMAAAKKDRASKRRKTLDAKRLRELKKNL